MRATTSAEIKKQKGQFWSRPGAAAEYERGLTSQNGIVRLKNDVERAIVLRNARGLILDAGTGTGRFAIALAQHLNRPVVALDYSREMLDLNRHLSSQQGIHLRYVQGDVEHLPFRTECFDTMVSITVVRHFPQYKNILTEYARVLKPDGIIIFEMCSGEHIRFANRIIPRFGVKYVNDGYFSYEVEIAFSDIHELLDSIGIDVVDRLTYDMFNNNCFLKILTINNFAYKSVSKVLGILLRPRLIHSLLARIELSILRYLPPAFSYNYMIIGRKRNALMRTNPSA